MSDQNAFLAMQNAVLEGDQAKAKELAEQALAAGLDPLKVIEEGFVAGIRRAGDLWEEGEFFLPELVTAAQAMTSAMEVLQPGLEGDQARPSAGRVVIGTVQGDIHDIGKTLVATMLTANGFSVDDQGADVAVARFVERAKEGDADLICASALLTTTMTAQGELVKAVREAGLKTRVMVGGAPVSSEWAKTIGADGYADNAVAAVQTARELIENG